jgi:hypothetical protein
MTVTYQNTKTKEGNMENIEDEEKMWETWGDQ